MKEIVRIQVIRVTNEWVVEEYIADNAEQAAAMIKLANTTRHLRINPSSLRVRKQTELVDEQGWIDVTDLKEGSDSGLKP